MKMIQMIKNLPDGIKVLAINLYNACMLILANTNIDEALKYIGLVLGIVLSIIYIIYYLRNLKLTNMKIREFEKTKNQNI
jgi:hypothetical protein